MYYSINNGLINFAKHIIKINNIDDLKDVHIPLTIYDNKIYCYTDIDLIITKNILGSIPYSVEDVVISDDIVNKTKNIIYQCLDEAMNHIENDVEPKSIMKDKLEQENIVLKAQLQQVEDVLLTLMFGGTT